MRVHFYLDRKKGRDKNLPVFLQYWHEGDLLRVFTGEHCDLDKWDKNAERVRKSVAGSGVINELLSSMEEEVVRIIREARIIRNPLTVNAIKKKLTFISGSEKDFFNAWDEFVVSESREKGWSEGTVKRMQVVKNHLIKINSFYRINFRTIYRPFYSVFMKYHTDNGYRKSYAKRNFDILRWFLNWGADKGYPVNMQYRRIKPERTAVQSGLMALNQEEVLRLLRYRSENRETMLVRDIFLLGCMTGLGYGEIVRLTTENIQDEYIIYTPGKMTVEVKVPLLPAAREIIQVHSKSRRKYLFSLPSIQYYNLILKRLGREAGLEEEVKLNYSVGEKRMERTFRKWELLSSKVARKTFIHIGASRGIGLDVMSELSGYHPGTIRSFYRHQDRSLKREINKIGEIYHTR